MGGKLQMDYVLDVSTGTMSGEWNTDCTLYGVTEALYVYELWFGDETGRAVVVHYPVETTNIATLRAAAEAMPTYAVTRTTGVYLDLLPAGWVRISGATHIRPGNGDDMNHLRRIEQMHLGNQKDILDGLELLLKAHQVAGSSTYRLNGIRDTIRIVEEATPVERGLS